MSKATKGIATAASIIGATTSLVCGQDKEAALESQFNKLNIIESREEASYSSWLSSYDRSSNPDSGEE